MDSFKLIDNKNYFVQKVRIPISLINAIKGPQQYYENPGQKKKGLTNV